MGINPLIGLIEELHWLHSDPTSVYNPGSHDASIPERWCPESLVRIRTVLRTEGSCWSFSILHVWSVSMVSFVQRSGSFLVAVDQCLSLIIVKNVSALLHFLCFCGPAAHWGLHYFPNSSPFSESNSDFLPQRYWLVFHLESWLWAPANTGNK